MDFLKKSIVRKNLTVVSAATVILCLFSYFGLPILFDALSASELEVGECWFRFLPLLPVIAVFLVCALSTYIIVDRPLDSVFHEMKAFLTGRSYRKIFTERIDEMGVLAHFFNDITRNLEKTKLSLAEGRRMSEELSVGTEIQKKILPTSMPAIPGIVLFGSTRPASEIGGDSFDIIQAAHNNTYIYVGDVTGHGIPAALIMVMVNTILLALSDMYPNGYDLMVNTNRLLKQQIEARRFMTCVLLRWNDKEQRLYYTGAGHEHIIIFRKKQGICEVRRTGGIALGMVADIAQIIKEEHIPMETGDSIVLYSDGIVEAKNMEGVMFGLDRLKVAVEQYGAISTPEELVAHISKDFASFVGLQTQDDDITLIAVQKS
ncbi:serine/threonine-protein phosphatase [Candidatus Peregrinibacteria bacterium]|nr:serine/threonine-protein phosphatase [Candidatus Peregrinibacteria bacterium]